MKHFILYLATALCMLTSCLGKVETTANADIVRVGQKLPHFEVTMNDGAYISSSSLQGKASVIVFFNTLCGDCRRELPIVQKVYADYGAKVQFMCISRAEGAMSVQKFWTENALTLPYSAQETKDVYSLFATSTIPRVYVSDVSGTVRKCFTESVSEKTLREAVEEVVRGI